MLNNIDEFLRCRPYVSLALLVLGRLKYPLSHKCTVTESSKQYTHSISDLWIRITICVLGSSDNVPAEIG